MTELSVISLSGFDRLARACILCRRRRSFLTARFAFKKQKTFRSLGPYLGCENAAFSPHV
jgi:hypothetical protein